MPSNFDINQLQSYIKQKQSEYVTLTSPGFQCYFWSRFNISSDIISDIQNNVSNVSSNAIRTLSSGDLSPNVFLSSSLNSGEVSPVRSIKVHNSIQDIGGSSAEIELINPDNIPYFQTTLGTIGV